MKTVSGLFEAQAARTPDAIAIVCGTDRITFAQLNARSNVLARRLIGSGTGIGAEARVAVQMRHSSELIVAVLAVLKAGAAFVGLDPHWPAARIASVVADAQAAMVLTTETVRSSEAAQIAEAGAEGAEGAAAETLDTTASFASPAATGNLHIVTPSDGLASVCYTSGSLGPSKGVLVTMRSIVTRLTWVWQAHPFQPGDAVLLHRSPAVTGFALDCFGPLLVGRPVIMSASIDTRDPAEIVRLAVEYGVTHLTASGSLWEAILHEVERRPGGWPTLRVGKTAGEPLRAALLESWRCVCPRATLVNAYGTTECASATMTDVAMPEVSAAGTSTTDMSTTVFDDIGRLAAGVPSPDAEIVILDDRRRPAGPGEEGEICLGGAALARGYLGQPAMTAERFVPNPIGAMPGSRLFRSGDRGMWRADGRLEVLGRRDLQVKIRGARVEIEEVEAALCRCPQVAAAAVHVRAGASGQTLVAHVVLRDAAFGHDLRATLLDLLPTYMIPSAFVVVDALPRTVTGKLDRRALPGLMGTSIDVAAPFRPSRSASEQAVAEIWETVLGLEEIGLDSNFFELGGQSLTGIQIVSQIQRRFAVEVPLRTLFETATVRGLAGELDRALAMRGPERPGAPDRQTLRQSRRRAARPTPFATEAKP
jgi:amino acid adenylation domain-containing protein